MEIVHSLLSPKYLLGVFSSEFNRPATYTLTFCVG